MVVSDYTQKIKRLQELAGIADLNKVWVLLPRSEAEAMRELLDQLKEIGGEDLDKKWTEIEVNSQSYWATGVQRDLS
jgi:hypothetical protein